MAIYHADISIVSRSTGASVVAGAAYLSRSVLTDERSGKRHDFTRAHLHERLVEDFGVSLPQGAAPRLQDRQALWNEVERTEKQSNAQLARRFVFALPDELAEHDQIVLAKSIINYFVEQGMVVDSAMHKNVNGTNCHIHLLTALRPVDENGFGAKAKSNYLVRHGDDETWMDAKELKSRQSEGWEKVFTYTKGRETRKLTPSQAENWDGCKRKSRNPEKRQVNSVDWSEQTKAEEWRGAAAKLINDSLEAAGLDVRVDHRSYERQGIDRLPTKHLGPYIQRLELEAQELAKQNGQKYQPVTELGKYNNLVKGIHDAKDRATREYRAELNRRIEELRCEVGTRRARLGAIQDEIKTNDERVRSIGGAVQWVREGIERVRERIRELEKKLIVHWQINPPAWLRDRRTTEAMKKYNPVERQKEKEIDLLVANKTDRYIMNKASVTPIPTTPEAHNLERVQDGLGPR